jgi:Uncharacterized protein conserved in bacteria
MPGSYVPIGELRAREGWTLQLVAGNYESTVLEVLGRASDESALEYTVGERQGRQWFMLLYGRFASQAEAQTAARNLPPELGVSNAWARAFRSL